MTRRSPDALTKHTLHLFEGDYAELQSLYPETGAAIIIRTLVRKHISETTPPLPIMPTEVDKL